MANVLYLVHRIPFPPNKGDKVRSYHLLKHLQRNHRVFLGTFIDDPQDEAHVQALQQLCPDLHIERIDTRLGKVKSLRGLLTGEALSVAFYRNARMHAWVQQVRAQHRLDATVVFSGAMAQFAEPCLPDVPMLVDFVDVDSTKWAQYAPEHRWPMSWLYRREGACLLAYERHVASRAVRSFLVTPQEADLFRQQAPEVAERVQSVSNGVDADFFSPSPACASPFAAGECPIVFTGAMDYWPNEDGVRWFVEQMMPLVRERVPQACFYIVGRNPTDRVRALAAKDVVVTGTVDDVRPYLQHARAVVAPLRVARGIQNKILEAMAMGQPVVTVPGCAKAIDAGPQQGLFSAAEAGPFVDDVLRLLQSPEQAQRCGARARAFVAERYSWTAHLSAMDALIPGGHT